MYLHNNKKSIPRFLAVFVSALLLLGAVLPFGTGAADEAAPGLVALLMPGDVGGMQAEGSLLFFDDDRYALSDAAGVNEFAERLVRRATEAKCGVLTLLCDRRVPAGDVMQVMALVRKRGLVRVQLAEKLNQ